MKTIGSMIVSCAAAIVVVAGCSSSPPQYRADALVEVRSSGDPITQRLLDSEVDAVLALAQAITMSGEKGDAANPRNTRMIRISVTAPDPQAAADSCNKIVDKYTLLTNGAIVRLLLERAVVSQYVNGRWRGTLQHDRATNAPTISLAAVQIWREGDRLLAAGDRTNALMKYKLVLVLYPNLGQVRTMVDELTQDTDPRAWFQQHPEDWGAWMCVFAELVNSNALAEAEEHLKTLPAGHDPETYKRSINERRHAIEMSKKRHDEVPTTGSSVP